MKEASQILKPKFVSLFTVMKEALRSVTWVKVAIRRTIKKKEISCIKSSKMQKRT